MAGKKGQSGRNPAPGRYYRFGYRYRPGHDPPELQDLLEAIDQATPAERARLIRSALVGGLDDSRPIFDRSMEDQETTDLLDDLLGV